MSDAPVRLLPTKIRLLRFDGEVFETFSNTDSTRYHVSLISNVEINEKKKRLQFDYGQIARPIMLGFDAAEIPAVEDFMRAVVAASGS